MGRSESFYSENLLGACNLSHNVYRSAGDDPSYVRADLSETTVAIAFRGILDPHVFQATATKFGECQSRFLEWLKDGNNQPACLHQGSLNQFLYLLNNSRFQEEALLEYERRKNVLFTGHSMGGAIAALATLWMLDKHQQQHPGKTKSFFCITFGFPLIGDETLARGVRRKGWTDQFCHVVLGRDVISRVLLAPSISVSEALESFLPYLKRYLENAGDLHGSTDTPMEEALPQGSAEFVSTVLQHCSAVANYSSATNMSPNNPLMAAVRPLVKLSPYRPFGHYLFCSKRGGIWIENHFAVFSFLYYALQFSDAALQISDASCDEFILEHVGYSNSLPSVLQNIVKLNELSEIPLSETGSNYQDSRTIQLEALGLGVQNCPARLALRAGGQVLKQQRENLTKLENEVKGKIEVAIKEIEEYRAQCLRNGTGYYDSFKKKQHRTDFDANLNRLKLAGWFDEIITMISKDELPDDFQCSEVWIRLGTHYRLLVEPLDIANYYRLGKNEDSGPYLRNARPRRYTILQKWLEENNVIQQQQPSPTGSDQPTMLTQDSCLWAYVEEIACLTLANNAAGYENSIAGLERSLRPLIDSNGLSMEELVAGNSTFNRVVKRLWENMTPLQKSTSPISDVIGRHPELMNSGTQN